MLNTITTIIVTSITVAGAVGGILSGFYKTNKEAIVDYEKINKNTDEKIHAVKQELLNLYNKNNSEFKKDFEKLSEQIEDLKKHYVSSENFKTYVESVNQLLRMSTDRMERIENTLDDIRDDINSIIRNK